MEARCNALVVEDHPLLRGALIDALTRDGRVRVLGELDDGARVCECVRAIRPDVVLLDLHLPTVDGAAVLDELVHLLPPPNVLVLTACDKPGQLLAVMRRGARGYLTKRQPVHEIVEATLAVARGETTVDPQLAGHMFATRAGDGAVELDSQELRVLQLLAAGATDRDIAAETFVSVRTVQNQLARIRRKSGMHRRGDLVRWAFDNGWLA